MLRLAFHLPLRQTEGLMASVFALMGVSLATPDHSTLSSRAMTITSISKGCRLPDGPVHLLIDSTGLKVYGAGEWLQEKHGVRARRTWRILRFPDIQFSIYAGICRWSVRIACPPASRFVDW